MEETEGVVGGGAGTGDTGIVRTTGETVIVVGEMIEAVVVRLR